ncbi:pyridoxamine 5'-phosphate oxidase family protein [Kibdelosporangium lantanae]
MITTIAAVIARAEFVHFARTAGLAVLATASPSGKPEAALVGIAVSDAGELVLDTPNTARKLANIAENDQVAVVIGWADGVSVQVEGRIRVVTGDERRTYERIYTDRFPGSRVADPGFTVAVVTPEWGQRYDATTNPARVEPIDFGKG